MQHLSLPVARNRRIGIIIWSSKLLDEVQNCKARLILQVWTDLYEAELGDLPSELQAPCCAEFIVSRERILAHSRDFYIHMRDWIIDTELGRYRSGRVFEYMWHVIFGEPNIIDAVPECQLLYCDNS